MKRWLLLATAALTSGCGSLNKPALPRFATGEAPAASSDSWSASLRRVDVVYCSLTTSGAPENQPAWRVVESFRASNERVALGWVELPVAQQPLFDQWQRQEISAPQLLERLGAPQRADWLRRGLRPELLQVALGAPRPLLSKIAAGDALSPEERALLPRDFRPRPDAFDNFADRIAGSSRLRRFDPVHLYRAHLAAEQMIAQNIVQFLRATPGVKLVVFLPNEPMIDPREVADYVAQKAGPRQMILDRSGGSSGARPQLLAGSRGRPFQVVNRAPQALANHRRFAFPRLSA